jgi:hypothetical protein
MNITIILTLDVLITFLACNILGPASFKLGGLGLVGWAARVPFLFVAPVYRSGPSQTHLRPRTAPHGIQRGFRRDFHNRETALQSYIPLKRAA